MKIVSVIARYLLGLIFMVFGLNGFLNFIHQPPPTNPLAIQFFVAIERVAFCRVLLRRAVDWRAAVALRLLRAARAHGACGGVVQHPCLPPHACAGKHCSGAGSLCAVGAGLPAVPQQLQRRSSRKACGAGIVCFVAGRPSASLLRNIFRLDTALLRIRGLVLGNALFVSSLQVVGFTEVVVLSVESVPVHDRDAVCRLSRSLRSRHSHPSSIGSLHRPYPDESILWMRGSAMDFPKTPLMRWSAA